MYDKNVFSLKGTFYIWHWKLSLFTCPVIEDIVRQKEEEIYLSCYKMIKISNTRGMFLIKEREQERKEGKKEGR